MAIKASSQISIVDVSDGVDGKTGKGVASVTPEYYLSTSKTTQTGGSWSTTPPTWSSGKYLWVRQIVTYTDSSVSRTQPYCDTSWEAVKEVQVGGRNLFLHTREYDGTRYTGWVSLHPTTSRAIAPYTYIDGFGVQRISKAWLDLSQEVPIETGTNYTLSAWIKWENEVGVLRFYAGEGTSGSPFIYQDVSDQVGADMFRRVSYTYNSGTSTLSTCRFECTTDTPYLIYGLKLEKGNKATDWTPAPEDVDHAIDNIQVGGRNLLLNTGESSSIIGTNTADQCLAHHDLACGSITKLEAGEYTCSADIIGTVEGGTAHMQFYGPPWETIPEMSGNVTVKTTKQKIGGTFTLTSPQSFSATGMRVRTDNVSGTITVSNMKLEKGNKATDWSPAPEDVEADATKKANEAAKTATNYMKFLNYDGLIIGDMTADTLGKNVLIDSDSVDIRNGDTVLASYGDNIIYLGKNGNGSTIDLCSGNATISAEIIDGYSTGIKMYSMGSITLSSSRLNLGGRIIEAQAQGFSISATSADISGQFLRIDSMSMSISGQGLTIESDTEITSTLVLSKTTDASGTENKSPALIVGGTATTAHIEIDSNEIMAKSNGTTPTGLTLNNDGGNVYIGNGGSGNLIGVCQIVKMGSKQETIKYQSGRTKALIEFWKTSVGSGSSHTVYDSAYVTGLSNKMTAVNVNISNGPDFSFTYSISKSGEITVSGTFSKYRITYFN